MAHPSSVTTHAAGRSIVCVDAYGLERTFDHVRLSYRADGTLATRTLFDTAAPQAMIVTEYDEAGGRVARHEIDLPGRPYKRLDIAYGADGWVETRTRSGFADGDLVSVTVRLNGPGEIAQVEHLHADGTRLVVGTGGEDLLAGQGGSADRFVPLDGGALPSRGAEVAQSDGDHVDLSHVLSLADGHLPGLASLEGEAIALRFDRVDGRVLMPVDADGERHTDASVSLGGMHGVHGADFGF